jgi:hypothetical protein
MIATGESFTEWAIPLEQNSGVAVFVLDSVSHITTVIFRYQVDDHEAIIRPDITVAMVILYVIAMPSNTPTCVFKCFDRTAFCPMVLCPLSLLFQDLWSASPSWFWSKSRSSMEEMTRSKRSDEVSKPLPPPHPSVSHLIPKVLLSMR